MLVALISTCILTLIFSIATWNVRITSHQLAVPSELLALHGIVQTHSYAYFKCGFYIRNNTIATK